MIEVEATHLTPSGRQLVCELFPGVFVVDEGGIYAGPSVPAFVALPPGSGRTFSVSERCEEFAAERYETLQENARFAQEYPVIEDGPVPPKFIDRGPLRVVKPPAPLTDTSLSTPEEPR